MKTYLLSGSPSLRRTQPVLRQSASEGRQFVLREPQSEGGMPKPREGSLGND